MRFGKGSVDWQQRVDFDRLREGRVQRANQMLDKHGIGAAIVYNWDSKRYLSSCFNHPYGRHVPEYFVLLIRGAGFPYVHVGAIDGRRVKEDCPWLEGKLVTDEEILQPLPFRMKPLDDARKQWARTAQQVKSLLQKHGVADMPLSVDYAGPHLIKALENVGLTVVDGNSWMQEARMVKLEDEVLLMKMAATINEAGYSALVREFRPGMRENDAQGIVAKAAYQAGGEYIEGWVVASGERAAPRSFNYTDKVVRPGELLCLEACHINYCGYKVCYGRTFHVGGKPTELQREIYKTAREMQERVRDIIKPGVTTHEVAKRRPVPTKAIKTMEDIRGFRAGWSNHFGGQGMGWNEAPTVSLDEAPVTLEKNMIIAYAANFHVEGYNGVHLENTYRITDTGTENLCAWPWEELTEIPL